MEYDDVLLADGFDDALIGFATNPQNSEMVAVYDEEKCILVLMDRDGMSHEEAVEFFSYNVEGSYVGKLTPIFVSPIRDHELSEMRLAGGEAKEAQT